MVNLTRFPELASGIHAVSHPQAWSPLPLRTTSSALKPPIWGGGEFRLLGPTRFWIRPYVAACEKVLAEVGLKMVLHANGTNIEGEWDKVFAAIKRCHQVVHEMGAPRISTFVHLGTRTNRTQAMDDKIRSVEAKLAGR